MCGVKHNRVPSLNSKKCEIFNGNTKSFRANITHSLNWWAAWIAHVDNAFKRTKWKMKMPINIEWIGWIARQEPKKGCCCYIVVLFKIAFYGVETSLEIAVLINELSEYENWNFFTSKIYPDTLKQSAISCQSIASTANFPNKVRTMHNLNYESEKKVPLAHSLFIRYGEKKWPTAPALPKSMNGIGWKWIEHYVRDHATRKLCENVPKFM